MFSRPCGYVSRQRANAFIVRRGKVKGYHDLAYYLGEANALTDLIDFIHDYEENHQ